MGDENLLKVGGDAVAGHASVADLFYFVFCNRHNIYLPLTLIYSDSRLNQSSSTTLATYSYAHLGY